MTTLEEIKKKKMEGLMAQQGTQHIQEQAQIQKQIEQLESTVKQFFTNEALIRYGNLKTAHPEKAIQLLLVLAQAMQKGQITSKIDDSILKKILKQMTPEQRDIRIRKV